MGATQNGEGTTKRGRQAGRRHCRASGNPDGTIQRYGKAVELSFPRKREFTPRVSTLDGTPAGARMMVSPIRGRAGKMLGKTSIYGLAPQTACRQLGALCATRGHLQSSLTCAELTRHLSYFVLIYTNFCSIGALTDERQRQNSCHFNNFRFSHVWNNKCSLSPRQFLT